MKKTNSTGIESRAEAEAAMNDLAAIINNERKALADRDEEVLAVNQDYALVLGEYAEAKRVIMSRLKTWAETNPAEFGAGAKKSLEMGAGHVIGFRTSPPKLTLAGKAWNWAKVLLALLSAPSWRNFVRTKQEVDKEAILACQAGAKDKEEFGRELKRYGMKVEQEEVFFADPALTEQPARQTA